MAISVKLLGEMVVTQSDGAVLTVPTRKSRALLAYLLAHGRDGVPREHLAALLSPHTKKDQSLAILRQTTSTLQRGIRPNGSGVVFYVNRHRLAASRDEVDVDIWHIFNRRKLGHDPIALLALFDLYTAPFLETFQFESQPFTDWVLKIRQTLATEMVTLGRYGLKRCIEDDDHDHATQIAAQLCRIEPMLKERCRTSSTANLLNSKKLFNHEL